LSEKEFMQLNRIISTFSSLESRIEKSGFHRTLGLRDHMGEDCPYFRKSLSLFSRKDLKDLHSILFKLSRELESLERSDNGS